MAAFLRRTLPHSCQVQHTNRCLIRRYGADNRIKLKAFGLVSYSQMQNKINATASSAPDRPELQAASIHVAGNPTGVAAAHSLHLYPFVASQLDQSISTARASVRTDTLQRSTSTVDFKDTKSFNNNTNSKTIAGQSRSQQGPQAQVQCSSRSKAVSTSLVHKRTLCTKLGFTDHTVHFPNIYFLGQRANAGFLNMDLPQRHYATGPRSRHRDMSYYEVLNTTPNATQAQVKGAYFKLSKIYHPDKNAGSKEAQRKFASINEAYSVLGNLTLRKRYDRGTLNQRDVHVGVKPEENVEEEEMNRDPMYTSSGIPFSMEAKRQAKNMDDFFSQHYKQALHKEQRDKAERQQRIDEYMELQRKAKVSPLILAAFMITAIALAIRGISQKNSIPVNEDKKQSGAN